MTRTTALPYLMVSGGRTFAATESGRAVAQALAEDRPPSTPKEPT